MTATPTMEMTNTVSGIDEGKHPGLNGRANAASLEVTFDPPLDVGIESVVLTLNEAGIETFESCQGGAGHAYPEPTVRFHGNRSEGFKALAAALTCGHKVSALRRIWTVDDGEPTGPYWEMTFSLASCTRHT